MTKVTKKDYLKMLAEVVSKSGIEITKKEELQVFIQKEITMLENKASILSPKQKENETLKELILDILTQLDKAVTIAELQAEDEKLAELSNQRISAILTQLVKNEQKVVRTELKKKAYFKIA